MSNKFYREFEMQVHTSLRRFRRYVKKPLINNIDPWRVEISDTMLYQDIHTEEVECVDIVMPQDRLQELEDTLKYYEQLEKAYRYDNELASRMREEELLRIKSPAVMKAWQHYRTLLNLVKE